MTTQNFVQEILGQKVLVTVDFASPDGTTIQQSVANNTFTSATLINGSRTIEYSTTTETEEIVDLNNQGLAAATIRHVRATDKKITGAGMIHQPDLYNWVVWAGSGQPKNCLVTVGNSYSIAGSFTLTGFKETGDRQKGMMADITLEQAQPTYDVVAGGSIANAVANAVNI
jgi:hypothetical protein